MINKPIYLPVEETLDDYVEEFGGELIKKILSNPNFDNADYLFRKYKVVAELKTLEKDFFTAENYKKKINELYAKWVEEGLVPRLWGKALIQTQNLPKQCQLEFTNIVKKPLENRISKANNQIKETKKHLGIEDYKGVLILANDGNYSLESDAIMYLVSQIVNTQCTSIDSTIHFTLNMRADMPEIDKDILVWIDMHRNGTDGASREFLKEFGDGWFKFLEKKTGENIPVILSDEHDKLSQIKLIRNKIE
jgi:hypothetical protein